MAGSVLALKLIEHNFTVKVIDKPELSNCSKIAAGIYNPVVFKRLTKSWMLDEVLPEMLRFYKSQEERWNCKLVTERNIVKLFSEEQEIILWQKKTNGELENYLDKIIHKTISYQSIKQNEFGYSKVKRSGNLDVKTFLDHTRNFLMQNGSYLDEKFDHSELKVSETLHYKTIRASSIIFCEGHLIKHNPFFKYIPLKPAKGETLTIEADDLRIGDDIINKNAFVMNLNSNQFKVGATYNWEDLSDDPTQGGKEDLEAKLKKIINCNYKIISHEAGVRPSVIDRRPLLGKHPKYDNIYVFNGLGTKGVMLAPFFAEYMLGYLTNKNSLNAEVDVMRFNPLE